MAQKFIKSQNKNSKSIAFGKYFASAVYDEKFITTEQIADFIQQQCSIKKSDIKAALDELGGGTSSNWVRRSVSTVSVSSRSVSHPSASTRWRIALLPPSPSVVSCSSPRRSAWWSVRPRTRMVRSSRSTWWPRV